MVGRILIAGGGVGGLTLALACRRHGLQPLVLERADGFAEVGAGLQLSPNAMNVFKGLEFDRELKSAAFAPRALEARVGRSGRRVFRVPLADATSIVSGSSPWGAPYLHIHRADLIARLRACCAGLTRLGAEVVEVSRVCDDVCVRLADGREVRGDVLVGADGLRSTVRAALFGKVPARYTGYAAWRAVVPTKTLGELAPPPTACVWMGPGAHAVTYRLRGGELCNFVGVVARPRPPEESWQAVGARTAAQRDFAGWHPVIGAMIAEAPALHLWALYDRPALPRWSRGRATLLGDAAHPMLPFFAQGAAMAVEDAWVLADALSRHAVADALELYAARRQVRTARVQAASRANAELYHRRTPLTQIATYAPMWLAGRLAPGLVRARLNWLYGEDVTHSV